MEPAERPSAKDLIREREARGLLWSLGARSLYVGLFALLTVLHLLRVVRPGIAAETDREAVGTLAIQILALACIVFFAYHARRRARLILVGAGAAVLDVVLIAMLPVLWYMNLESPDGTVSFFAKNELFTLSVVSIAINALGLRALYPAIAASGFILLHAVLLAIVLLQPGVPLTDTYMGHYYTNAVNPGVTVVRMIALGLVGFFLAFLASTARRTIHDAVDLEVANAEIKERQVEMVLEGKMATLTDLVAGVAHEINSPLGAVRSSLETTASLARKLSRGESQPEAARLGEAAEASRRTGISGLDRIGQVVGSLRDFARLDQSEQKLADLRDGVRSVLSLIDPAKRGEVTIETELGEVPPIFCRPKEMNQVFMALVINALEAMDGKGRLRITTAVQGNRVRVSLRDTGPGIPPERLEGLFELKLVPKRGRVSFGLGLPTARRIVERHGGSLTVSSARGEGTEFLISLPLER